MSLVRKQSKLTIECRQCQERIRRAANSEVKCAGAQQTFRMHMPLLSMSVAQLSVYT